MRDALGPAAVASVRHRALRQDATASATMTLLLADEQPLVRGGLRALFAATPSFRIEGEAENGDALVELARLHAPDVVLMDAALPGPRVLEVVRHLARDQPHPIGVVLLVSEQGPADTWVLEAARAGARGLLLKSGGQEAILSGVRDVAAGGIAMSTEFVSQILKALHSAYLPAAERPFGDISLLTPREMQVFRLVSQGLTNQQISNRLVLSEATVKSHFNRICHKLDLRNRVDAVILAYETGIAGSPGRYRTTPRHERAADEFPHSRNTTTEPARKGGLVTHHDVRSDFDSACTDPGSPFSPGRRRTFTQGAGVDIGGLSGDDGRS